MVSIVSIMRVYVETLTLTVTFVAQATMELRLDLERKSQWRSPTRSKRLKMDTSTTEQRFSGSLSFYRPHESNGGVSRDFTFGQRFPLPRPRFYYALLQRTMGEYWMVIQCDQDCSILASATMARR